jgi:two-component system, OmpR family, sensor histidine kinase MprB
MSRLSFRQRLTLFTAAGIALVLVIGSAATYVVVRSLLREQIDDSLRLQSVAVEIRRAGASEKLSRSRSTQPELRLQQRGGPGDNAPRDTLQMRIVPPEQEFGNAPSFFQLIDTEEGAVTGLPALLPTSERAMQVARTGTGAFFTDVEVKGTPLRMYVRPAGSGQALLTARSLSEVNNALNRLGWSLAITCLAGIALAALVGAVVARGALRPVRTLTATAEHITDTHDLGERIETEGDDELSRLGSTFNAMLDSLEGAIRSQRQLVSDASHELRTPLTSLRTNIDLLRQGVALSERDRERLLRDITRELEELTTLVANIVELARGSQRDLHLEHVRLDELAERVVRRAESRFPRLEFALDAEETTVWGDPEELDRAVWNLVENAAKWSNSDARIELTIVGGEVTVRDHGPGVPEADRPFIFDRFYRSETARGRPGSGLGLAIVRQIAESHGGRVDVEDAEGGGARFRLVLMSS